MSDDKIDYGYVCSMCGLSDFGFQRLRDNGYTPHPCKLCRDHFNPDPKVHIVCTCPDEPSLADIEVCPVHGAADA